MASNKGQPTSVRYSLVWYKGAQQQNKATRGGISNGNGTKPANDDVADTSSDVDDSSAAEQTKRPVVALLNVVLFFVVASIVLYFILHERPEKISTNDDVDEGRHERSFKEFTDNRYTTPSHSSSFRDMKDKLRAGREKLQRKRNEVNEKRRHWSSLNRKKSEQSDDEGQYERWNTGADGRWSIEDVHFADDFQIDAQAVNDNGHDHSMDPEEQDRLRDQVEDLYEDEDPEEDRSIPACAYSSDNCQQKPSRSEIYSSTQDDVTHPDVIGDSDRELETESAVEEESKATDISHRDDSVVFATKPDVLSISTVSNDGTRVKETVRTTVTIRAMDTRDSVSAQMLPRGESIKVSVGGVDIYIPKDALKAALKE